MERDYRQELDSLLEEQGGLYLYEDIVQHILDGRMQSFATENTWLVTQVHTFPRRTVIDIVFAVGTMEDFSELEVKLEEFRKNIGASAVSLTGRKGWVGKLPGWNFHSVNLIKVYDGQ